MSSKGQVGDHGGMAYLVPRGGHRLSPLTIAIREYAPTWPEVMFKEKLEIQTVKMINQLPFKYWQLLYNFKALFEKTTPQLKKKQKKTIIQDQKVMATTLGWLWPVSHQFTVSFWKNLLGQFLKPEQ